MFKRRKKDQIDLSNHDFAKLALHVRKDDQKMKQTQARFAQLTKKYNKKKEEKD